MSFTIAGKTFPDALPELHTHVRSDKDAFIFPKKLVSRMKEMGMPGLAVTDHGVLSSIEDYRHAFDADKDDPLKLIPGVELYVENELAGRDHAILLAMDDEGYHGVSKIVTESNRHIESGYPTVTTSLLCEMAEKYKGHIIFMTACMQGVIASVFLRNKKIDRLIVKAEKKRDKYFSSQSDKYLDAEQELEETDKRIADLRIRRDELKRTAEQKFVSREKKIKKLSGDEKEKALELIAADKEAAAKAAAELPSVIDELKKVMKQRTKVNKDFSSLSKSAEKYDEYQKEIDDLKSQISSDDVLMSDAETVLNRYIAAFGRENVYGEIQYHGIEDEAICFPKIAELSHKAGIHLVATNDVHMLTDSVEDLLRRSILRSMRFQEKFEAPSPSDRELYLKTTKERYEILKKIFPDDVIAEAFEGIEEIYSRCNVEFKVSKNYPKASDDPKRDLEELVRKGIEWRFPDGFPDDKVYKDRILYELDVIESMGYDDYHLVVREFLNYGELLGRVPKERIKDAPVDTEKLRQWIKDNGWEKNAGYRIGTGRGSDGGSIVCYLLGITNLDPIQHGLLFERFLNKERVSMPDIDSDISADTRQKVIDHCKYVYGEKAVCGIMTCTFLAPKGAVNTAAKYYSMYKFGDTENHYLRLGREIADLISDEPNTSFDMSVDKNTGKPSCESDAVSLRDYLLTIYKDNKEAVMILSWAFIMEGVFTGYGAHAAGIVITEKGSDVSDVLPLKYNAKIGMMTTQCTKDDVEANGLLKFDFLGLKTLDIITETLFMIQESTGVGIDVLKLDIADEKVYEKIFQTGNTGAVFQFESDGMKKMLKAFRPSCFADLVLLVAAYRPGPMQFLDDIIAVKNGQKEITYLTPELEPILNDTYGAIIYQEQVMKICQDLAGYSLGGADLVRRAMSKKKAEKLAHERDAFIHGDKERGITGCVANGISEAVANKIFDQMMDFASYAFNKSHAAAYAYNSYITAWLKCYYPAEFYAAALNWADDPDKFNALLKDAKNYGMEVLPPDVNASDKDFTVENGKIRFALSKIKGIKDHSTAVIEERNAHGPFQSLSNFLVRVKTSSTVVKGLISSGAFDSVTLKSRSGLLEASDELRDLVKKYIEKKDLIMASDTLLDAYHDGMTDEEVKETSKTAGLKPVIKSVSSAADLEKKKEKASSVLLAIKRDMISIEARVLSEEDRMERLYNEKEYLGDFISDTPLSGYPDNEELRVAPISELTSDTMHVFGYIEDFHTAKTKKDGSLMAFFTITDAYSSIKALCFPDKYADLKDKIKEGAVFVFEGTVSEKKDETSFIVNKVKTPDAVNGTIIIDPGSLHLFHLNEDKFRNEYEKKDGFRLGFMDNITGRIREATYRVSEKVLECGLPAVRI